MKLKHKKRKIIISITLITIFFLFIFTSGIIFPEANLVNSKDSFTSPSLQHLFGTDQFGRDVFIRTVIGFRYTFTIALFVQIISFAIGIILGIILGYYGGIIDEIFYQISNLLLSFPMIILAILMSSLTGANMRCLISLMIVYTVVSNSKIVRSEIKIIKNEDYIKVLRVLGASDFVIIKNHLVKKCLRMLLPTFALFIGHIIIAISSYSFIGFGVQPPQPEIGNMLKESLRFINRSPGLMIFPGLFQFFSILLLLRLSENCKTLFLDREVS
ncbi:MAG: ABC transporter permease [Vallitalea sp.]|nr:ABC transporter permease [Vallitalea sp.]